MYPPKLRNEISPHSELIGNTSFSVISNGSSSISHSRAPIPSSLPTVSRSKRFNDAEVPSSIQFPETIRTITANFERILKRLSDVKRASEASNQKLEAHLVHCKKGKTRSFFGKAKRKLIDSQNILRQSNDLTCVVIDSLALAESALESSPISAGVWYACKIKEHAKCADMLAKQIVSIFLWIERSIKDIPVAVPNESQAEQELDTEVGLTRAAHVELALSHSQIGSDFFNQCINTAARRLHMSSDLALTKEQNACVSNLIFVTLLSRANSIFEEGLILCEVLKVALTDVVEELCRTGLLLP